MDLIDRQAILRQIHEKICTGCTFIDPHGCAVCNVWSAICEIKNAPTVEPKRGEWIYKKGKPYCSECGSAKPYFDGEILSYWVGDYCRMCGAFLGNKGADMRGEEDE